MPQPKKHVNQAQKQRAYRQRCKLKSNETLRLKGAIVSLCDFSGSWSQPYADAGYEVVRVDLKTGQDVRLMRMPDYPVHGILAAPPCTHFALSGARWWSEKGETALLDGLSIVDACLRLVALCKPAWWALENPVGRLNHYLGKPVMYFNPCDYGDTYTKKTALWGSFNPALPWDKVAPVEGSKMWANYGGKSEATKAARSVTPEGFAMAFFLANP